ncbi:uncharacterized protein LOC120067515 [Benincasa hispida]|uniref:uncharacterized protein LOC120067515 n=1 Tax=Benincasa hispida TaxID=102211 RepID=UPI001901377A|nr:uncharacterized protein LOC120067515 [Benincasa hispida]
MAQIQVRPTLIDKIIEAQKNDEMLKQIQKIVERGYQTDYDVRSDGAVIRYNPVCLPNRVDIKQEILEEAHSSAYTIHPGSTKMYPTLKQFYWWPRMKRDIAEYVLKCMICQQNGHDGIWVIIDRLTKIARFLPVKATYYLDKLAKMYVAEVVSRYGAPVSIVSNQDPIHVKVLAKLATRPCYHSSIEMAPYEALYGRKCRTPVCWDEVGERNLFGPELVQITTNTIKIIREKLKTTQDPQKSYADKHRRYLEFEVGDRVFLNLSPWKGVLRFGKKGKVSPRYIGTYEILECIGSSAYHLTLPIELSKIYDVFHVSMLRKYISDPSHVLESQPLQLKENLSYEEEPVQIIDRKEQVLRNKTIPLVKVLWRNHGVEEATWESEQQMRTKYPHFFLLMTFR